MSARGLKIALAVLVMINVFALAALGTTLLTLNRIESRIEGEARPNGERRSPRALMRDVDPETRERVGAALRASALAARPDFDEARRLRREALAGVGTADFDPKAVAAALDLSRAAELRGRKRIEDDALALMATLDPDDRARLAPMLTRSGGRGRRDRDRPAEGPPPPRD